jgi:hypothetical protein
MRAIQAVILVCLLGIAGLVFAIYEQQAEIGVAAEAQIQSAAAKPAAPELLTEEVRGFAPIAVPPAETQPAKPTPVVAKAPAPKPRTTAAATKETKQPASAPPPVIASEPPAIEIPAAVAVEEAKPEPAASAEDTVAEAPPAEPSEETPPAPREPRMVTVPSGQRLTVRLDSTLSTSRSRVDDTFFATLDEPLIVDGLVIADKGARLEGRVVESEQAGRVKGLARLACELTKLHSDDGQVVGIATSTFSIDGESSRNDDLKKVAVGAGAGAILGAILGGGKGAAIGAASGAGAGVGAAAATRGEPAVLEPETRMDFRLAEDVTITEKL